MPIIKIDMIKGRNKQTIKQILEISYRVGVEVFNAPERDRFQFVYQHEDYEMVMLDNDLGIERTSDMLLFTWIVREKSEKQKREVYKKLTDNLNKEIGIRKEDIMIVFVENKAEDWSFGNGEAQFINGDLEY